MVSERGLPERPDHWRVFLSHTGELGRFPAANSYVQVAMDAVQRAGHYPIDMRHFPNRDVSPSEIDRDQLETCDVYLGIYGFCWGSPSVSNPEMSYTEEEYETAAKLGIPRRVFLLSEDSAELKMSPIELGFREENLEKQMAFRSRVLEHVTALVRGPEHLAATIVASLADLERLVANGEGSADSGFAPRTHNIPVHGGAVVRRESKIDEVVGRLREGSAVRVTSVKGAGGVGKTILAEQVCRDPRVVQAFPGGTWKVTLGEHPDIERSARELYRVVTGRDATGNVSPLVQLAEAFTLGRALVLIDDVWPPDEDVRRLMEALPYETSVLITTRGVSIPDTEQVGVDELTDEEARRLLIGAPSDAASPELTAAADDLIQVLGSWALLVDMAARLLVDDLTRPPGVAADAFRSLAREFRGNPTILDDDSSRHRSFATMIERSLNALTEPERGRFVRLSVFPPRCRARHPTPLRHLGVHRDRGTHDEAGPGTCRALSGTAGSTPVEPARAGLDMAAQD